MNHKLHIFDFCSFAFYLVSVISNRQKGFSVSPCMPGTTILVIVYWQYSASVHVWLIIGKTELDI